MSTRYHRHDLIDWFSQEKISRTKVAVIGAGAVGNEVIKDLALLGVGHIDIFDLDLIEEHNLTRSVLFRDSHIGRSKAEVAAEQAMVLDTNISARGIHGDFWDHLGLSDLRTFDLLLCCVDNFEARIRCNTLCLIARIDFVNIGIDSRSALVELFPFSQAPNAGCLECNLPESVYRHISERYSCGYLRKLSFVEKKIPTTIITSTAAASLAVSLGLRLGAHAHEPAAMRVYLDTIAGSLTRCVLGRAESCPCCGRFGDEPVIVASRPDVESLPLELGLEATVVTSEPILVGYRIGGEEYVVFERASKFDSSFPETIVEDDPGSVEIEVRDQFSIAEIASRFSGRSMPCKFAIVSTSAKTIVCEFGERTL